MKYGGVEITEDLKRDLAIFLYDWAESGELAEDFIPKLLERIKDLGTETHSGP